MRNEFCFGRTERSPTKGVLYSIPVKVTTQKFTHPAFTVLTSCRGEIPHFTDKSTEAQEISSISS